MGTATAGRAAAAAIGTVTAGPAAEGIRRVGDGRLGGAARRRKIRRRHRLRGGRVIRNSDGWLGGGRKYGNGRLGGGYDEGRLGGGRYNDGGFGGGRCGGGRLGGGWYGYKRRRQKLGGDRYGDGGLKLFAAKLKPSSGKLTQPGPRENP